MTQATAAPQALSTLSEEETMFREAVREFAETEVKPHVHDMDEAAKFRPEIIAKFFEHGADGHRGPRGPTAAPAASIFMATLAIEELARVDASAAIYVDVHNTLVNNALLRWGTDEQKRALFPRMTTELLGAFALSEPEQRQRRLRPRVPRRRQGRATGSSPAGSSGSPTAPRRGSSSSSPTPTSPRATRASPRSWWSATSRASRWARRRTSSASAPPAPPS